MNEETLFHLALAKPAGERAAFLEQAAAGDVGLRRRVEALLQAHEHPGSFMGKPAVDLGSATADAPRPKPAGEGSDLSLFAGRRPRSLVEGPGSRIGPYKLLQQIGEGGMGAVFMAEQTQPVQRMVALKIIKPGMDSALVIARFEQERQALAMMDHPNIARVLDAGTTGSGRPYFVMELVKGMPIITYCDDHHLTPRQRLELFVPVCRAVQHAHQKGIIHRDLKPSNVLIALYDGKPVPKVIDFGVAKATGPKLTDRTLFTEYGSVVGTLEYMSPEQAELNQLDIDTRSDIYSLGVLMYELLTGTTPLDRKRLKESSLLEALRLIREEEPQRPSARLSTTAKLPSVASNRGLEPKKLSGLVRGELDWIVMKCLEKDRNRRYDTANGLARDIERYLNDEPVEACPPSLGYRLRKLSRRYKAPLVTALGLLVALAVGTGLVWRERQEALRQRDEADEQRLLAQANLRKAQRAVDDSFTLMSESTLLNEPTLEPLRKELLLSALRYYEGFVQEYGDDPELQAELVAAHLRMTNLTYVLSWEEDWLSPFQKGIAVMEELMRKKPDVSALRSLQAGIFRPLAVGLPTPNPEEVRRTLENAILIWEELVREHPSVPGFRNDLAVFYIVLTVAHERLFQSAEAVKASQRARDLLEPLRKAYPDVPHYQSSLVLAVSNLCSHLAILGRGKEAEETDRQAMALSNQLVTRYPEVPAYRELLAWSCGMVAKVREEAGRRHEAEEARRREVASFDELAKRYPRVPRFRRLQMFHRQWLGELLWRMDRRTEAADVFREYLRLGEAIDPRDGEAAWLVPWMLAACPDPQFRDAPRAVELAKKAVELAPKDAGSWNTLGLAHHRAGNWQAAIEALERSSQLTTGGDSYDFFFLAMAHWQLGNKDKARQWYDQGVQWMDKNWPRGLELSRFRAEAKELLGL